MILVDAIDTIGTLEQYMFVIWLSVFGLACLIELVTTKLAAVFFAASSVVSLALSLIPNVPFWVEIIVFLVLTPLLFLLRKPICHAKKRARKEEDKGQG